MRPDVLFLIVFVALTVAIYYCDKKYAMLRDTSTLIIKPFSLSRVQMAWWTLIVLSSFITILIVLHQAPNLRESTLILLGISSATRAT